MDKNTTNQILNIFKIVVSIILAISAAISMLGATLINVGRNYINSEDFKNQVNTTDLSEIKFVVRNEKTSVGDFMKDSAKDYVESQNKYFFSFAEMAIDQILSSDLVNNVVKNEVLYLADFFINSDPKAAKDRLEKDVPIDSVLELNPRNAKSMEEAVRIYMRSFVVTSLEKTSRMPSDQFIVFLSKDTVVKLVFLSILLLILLVLVNRKTILNVILYSGFSSLLCGIIIKAAQSKFDEMNQGLEDLVGYVFLKPLADAYSSNAIVGFIAGAILIVLFVVLLFLLKPQPETQEIEE